MSKPTDNQDETKEVLEVIQEIIQKSSDSDYIYRGEPDYYEKVSSSLYRMCKSINIENFIRDIQKDILNVARTYTLLTDEIDILSQLQHYGGTTNLIDFTTDYNIALFFACDGKPNKNGKIILKKKENVETYIRQPRIPAKRIIAQKSIFIQPPEGFEEPDEVVCIPAKLKNDILDHLIKHHNISTKTIYNDIHGLIKLQQKTHKSAYMKLLEGNKYIIKKEHKPAIKSYTKAIRLFPQFALAYANRGNAKTQLEQYKEAVEDCNKALEIDPQLAIAYNNRGNAKTKLKQYKEAVEDCNKALEIDPQFAEVYNNRGSIKTELGQYKEAIKDFSKALEIYPQFAEVYNNRGSAKTKLKRYKEAIKDFNKALEIYSQFAIAYVNRSLAKTKLKQYKEAIKDCNKALEIDSQSVEAYVNRGFARTGLGQYKEAIKDFNKALEIDSQSAEAYYNRGNAKIKIGQYKEAVEDFNKTLEINRQFVNVHYYLGIVRLCLSEWESAKTDLITAKNQGVDIAKLLQRDYKSVTNFEKKFNITLPADIRALLTYKSKD